MTDSDVIAKLSRILETHSFGDDPSFDDNYFDSSELGKFMKTASSNVNLDTIESPKKSRDDRAGSSPKRTPFDMWQNKQKNGGKTNDEQTKTKIMTENQKDKLVQQLFRQNKNKESSTIKVQNEGLKLELTGHEFKPKLNKISRELTKSMKPLLKRVPGLDKEKEDMLQRKRDDKEQEMLKECSFKPNRVCAKTSDHYLKRLGRSTPLAPEDFFQYKKFQDLRNDQRKQILQEIESKELTFQPQINANSKDLHEKQKLSNSIEVCSTTRIIVKNDDTLTNLKKGVSFIVESDHPYKNNLKKSTPIYRVGAVAYQIIFDPLTSTESVYDFIKFYRQDSNEGTWGAEKYSGGVNNSHSNWPGIQNRPALVIPSPKFTIYFQTNGSVNGWGYKMTITPYYPQDKDAIGDEESISNTMSIRASQIISESVAKAQTLSGQPVLVSRAKGYHDAQGRDVHDRLYQQGKELLTEKHNSNVELLSKKLNLNLRPWESHRNPEISASWTQQRNFLAKPTKTAEDYLWNNGKPVSVSDSIQPPICFMNYDDSTHSVWKFLKKNTLLSNFS